MVVAPKFNQSLFDMEGLQTSPMKADRKVRPKKKNIITESIDNGSMDLEEMDLNNSSLKYVRPS